MGKAMTMLMLANRANEHRDGDGGRREDYPERGRQDEHGLENRRRERDTVNESNFPYRQYPKSEDMRRYYENDTEKRPYPDRSEDAPEMRRHRDKRGRYMGDNGEEVRMGMYDGGDIGYHNDDRRSTMHDKQGKMIYATGSVWMDNDEDEVDTGKLMEWVHHMRDDEDKPIEPWSADEIKPLARRFGYPTTGEEFADFYTAIHMMKSDYCAVAEEFDVNTPACYAALADAWLKDPDAKMKGHKKLEAYYKHVVMGK